MEELVNVLEDFFISLESPILQAFVGGLFTWILTALGAKSEHTSVDHLLHVTNNDEVMSIG